MPAIDLKDLERIVTSSPDRDDPDEGYPDRPASWWEAATDADLIQAVRRAAARAAALPDPALAGRATGTGSKPGEASGSPGTPLDLALARLARADRSPRPGEWVAARLSTCLLLLEDGDFDGARQMALQASAIAGGTENAAGARTKDLVRRIGVCASALGETRPRLRLFPLPRMVASAMPVPETPTLDRLMDLDGTTTSFAVSAQPVGTGDIAPHVLPNMCDRHMAAAGDACRRALADAAHSAAPLSTVLHCVGAIEAYANLARLFLAAVDDPRRTPPAGSDCEANGAKRGVRNQAEGLRRLYRQLSGGEPMDQALATEVKLLIELRHLLVHADTRLGGDAAPTTQRTRDLLAGLERFATPMPGPPLMIDRILTPGLALWAIGVSARLQDAYRAAWKTGRPTFPDERETGDVPQEPAPRQINAG
ncbi:hypothetical protein [Methylobacterium pseudosasicola]|uniref:Uncharacterized protein n=1 Tax=Methylobacterium pseudosasicola TaxID=582667 RepID=A0A1I4PXT7_9HYPH|nr:hypothetical protein [Methylobacterium pseudosasicola]SFM32628.1 hypothetical protein SAMN05192568_102720 [Methylobacterium pseudosasicola]